MVTGRSLRHLQMDYDQQKDELAQLQQEVAKLRPRMMLLAWNQQEMT